MSLLIRNDTAFGGDMKQSRNASDVQVGRFRVPFDVASTWVSDYVANEKVRYGYPAYDQFKSSSQYGALEDADLLAPALLNVRSSLVAYYWLHDQLPSLNRGLKQIPRRTTLLDPNPPIDRLGSLFGVLDQAGRSGVKLTTLAKVLHRKRPAFIPLWDQYVANCYSVGHGAPVPIKKGRSWANYATAIASAMRADLATSAKSWHALADMAADPGITPLRALDIVAWNRGREQLKRLPRPRRSQDSLLTSN